MSLDLFELQAFPNHEQQKDTIDNYFDTQSLWVDIKNIALKIIYPKKSLLVGLVDYLKQQIKILEKK